MAPQSIKLSTTQIHIYNNNDNESRLHLHSLLNNFFFLSRGASSSTSSSSSCKLQQMSLILNIDEKYNILLSHIHDFKIQCWFLKIINTQKSNASIIYHIFAVHNWLTNNCDDKYEEVKCLRWSPLQTFKTNAIIAKN